MPELTYHPDVFDELPDGQQFLIPGAIGAMAGLWEKNEGFWLDGRYRNARHVEKRIPHTFELAIDVLVPSHQQVSLFEGVC